MWFSICLLRKGGEYKNVECNESYILYPWNNKWTLIDLLADKDDLLMQLQTRYIGPAKALLLYIINRRLDLAGQLGECTVSTGDRTWLYTVTATTAVRQSCGHVSPPPSLSLHLALGQPAPFSYASHHLSTRPVTAVDCTVQMSKCKYRGRQTDIFW